ncbi:2,4-dienoyl-CoA reductase-like NADH-dependent reductase (Old Yellow Enzyme family) [Halanaerobium saccharolyticum]|uniref:2,4-dienoyl-CoA reductase-like NADH-dependent reductase (Old Yellow Enzyme family) n=1 Tax=Halanaerobium saccharolyticum TaxID=43595 RepID=A0A4R7YW43_9FIRM|nr:NADH:flavin oxidoreductase [Halanaerobium saccharolyticum]RAK06870.1 2,4-dienoyl-CoA reductase-like NADH-dependent reductase (Old Yellow Enzyme family) [Halanaerobium saccharolyticum]TDW01480.1 2,4-dienoyl-CoA reductase-like NADH-dependent reductase (Old Yellow Enzyme family) [Halanaerobium saccharolyticum]TDX52841.1 2,4-dienoyl-CoA reductase-like NADH-dependent reductase (Old Yellow Enzyme family) [Halanaerobium saccharolyticum]
MKDQKFNYSSLKDLRADLSEIDFKLPLTENTEILSKEIKIENSIIPNRVAIHPMEGADSNPDGTPSDLTRRRYKRFANGGAGLIWMEAIAVDDAGRANKSQLYLKEDNLAEFKDLIEFINKESRVNPYVVAQLTHSGRFGENNIIAFRDKDLDPVSIAENDFHIITDSELDQLQLNYLKAAELAAEAGFDAVDIKSCHRYLLSSLLAAFDRKGKYGGSYKNRTRFLRETIKKVKENVDIDITVRLNIYDAIPGGWATDKNGEPELGESAKLIKDLESLGAKMINVTASTPYLKPHVNRPYDKGGYKPPEHPLRGVQRLLELTKFTRDNLNQTLVLGTGFSWLRQYGANAAAGMIAAGWTDLAGFGRQAFAYPDFVNDIFEKGEMDKSKVCISCSKCAELKAAKKKAGCVIRDQEIYLPIYRELQQEKKADKLEAVSN